MFAKIMCPVDLSHIDELGKALKVAGEIAKTYESELVYVGIAPTVPGSASHTPKEYRQKLDKLAHSEGETYGVKTSARVLESADPTAAVNHLLQEAAEELAPDLIVMATHTPNVIDHIWSAHGTALARSTDASIFLVRK
jgi:nucleotide-binding universal stress UspA family protein